MQQPKKNFLIVAHCERYIFASGRALLCLQKWLAMPVCLNYNASTSAKRKMIGARDRLRGLLQFIPFTSIVCCVWCVQRE